MLCTSSRTAGRTRSSSAKRVWGMEGAQGGAKWTLTRSSASAAVPEHLLYQAAKLMADNRPGTFIWCMGGTQHTHRQQQHACLPHLPAGAGNMGRRRRRHHIFAVHDNVQVPPTSASVRRAAGLFRLAEGAWSTGRRSGAWTTSGWPGRFEPGSYEEKDGKPLKPMNTNAFRCRGGSTACSRTRPHQAEGQHPRHGVLGATRRTARCAASR